MEAKPGCLLIASPQLADPSFVRSVIFLIEHDTSGSLGLIINRTLELPLGEVWESCPNQLYNAQHCAEGGPVERDRGLLLHPYLNIHGAHPLAEGLAIGGDTEAIINAWHGDHKPHRGPRLFLGHAGWSPEQLNDEIASGSWLVRQGPATLAINPSPPKDLWQELVTTYEDTPGPSLN